MTFIFLKIVSAFCLNFQKIHINFNNLIIIIIIIITLTLNIPSLGRQRFYQAGVLGGHHGFFVISQLFDAVDYSNYVFWGF